MNFWNTKHPTQKLVCFLFFFILRKYSKILFHSLRKLLRSQAGIFIDLFWAQFFKEMVTRKSLKQQQQPVTWMIALIFHCSNLQFLYHPFVLFLGIQNIFSYHINATDLKLEIDSDDSLGDEFSKGNTIHRIKFLKVPNHCSNSVS